MKLIVTIFLILLLVIIIFTSKIKIKIYKRAKNMLIMDLYLFILIHKQLNITKIFKKFVKNHSAKENINKIIYSIRLYIRNNILISKLLKATTVKRISFTTGYNTNNTLLYPYVTVLNYSIVSSIKSLIDSSFKKIEKEYYGVLMNDESKKGINIDLVLSIPLYKIVFIIITNLKEFIKLMKYLLKEKEKSGRKLSSDQSIITNSDGFA